jgi:HSP20 family protein
VIGSKEGIDMASKATVVSMDFFENEHALFVLADMPGVREHDISVTHEPGVLRIQAQATLLAERLGRPVRYFRELSIDSRIEPDSIDATLHNGLLKLRIAKPANVSRALIIDPS